MDQEFRKLIEENVRMKVALEAILAYAQASSFGRWRFDVSKFSMIGLDIEYGDRAD